MAQQKIFWAIKLANGNYLSRDNSPSPALYLTAAKAEATLLKHFPGHADGPYQIVMFKEV